MTECLTANAPTGKFHGSNSGTRDRRRRLVARMSVLSLLMSIVAVGAPSAAATAQTVTCSGTTAVAASTTEAGLIADCDALLGVKATLDPGGVLNWATTLAMADWDGVTLTTSPARVRALDLATRSLTGTIPAELGDLTALTSLRLYDNDLTGSIPAELGGLTNLTRLSLDGNGLTGSIPVELGGLTNLTVLYLYDNDLSGAIPVELGGLTNLTELLLHCTAMGCRVRCF